MKLRLLAAVCAVLVLGVAGSVDANATRSQVKVMKRAGFNDCPDGWVCLWSSMGWSGTMVQFQDRGVWTNLSGYGFNDTARSWRNRTADDARVAENTSGGGDLRCLGQNDSGTTFGTFNDMASSIRIYTTSTIC